MKFLTLIFLALVMSPYWGYSQNKTISKPKTQPASAPKNKAMYQAVNAFLAGLSAEQRAQATFTFADEERYNWNFVPLERKGLRLKDMNPAQRKLAIALLQTTMSEQGYSKAKAIMELEVVLKALEKLPPENDRRDPEKYYFSVFGKPSEQDPWGWRVEGHHLSLNFSSVTGLVAAQTPAFMGSNPAIVPEGPAKGKQILKQEADMGFALLDLFSPEQLKQVIIAEVAPNEIVTSNTRKVLLDKPVGINYNQMTPPQKKAFDQLLLVYLNNYQQELAQAFRKKVEKAGMDQMYFAWAGSLKPVLGQAHYYRIQNPVLLIEYDNSQNEANHVHTVIRDLTNDFGEDALQSHYQKHQHKK